jgi:hypothetical protein
MDNSKYYILLIGIIVIFESIAQYHINESKIMPIGELSLGIHL